MANRLRPLMSVRAFHTREYRTAVMQDPFCGSNIEHLRTTLLILGGQPN